MPLVWATALIFIPGLVIGLISGLRGLILAGLAPAISVGIIAASALVAPFAHIRWGIFPVFLGTLIAALCIATVRIALRKRQSFARISHARGTPMPWILGWVIAAIAIATRMVVMIGNPTNISQTFDNIFHLNAVRYVLNSGDASSLTLADLNPHGHFYPAAWHALASLIVMTSGTTIPIAVNALTIVICAVAWPVGVIFAVRILFGAGTGLLLGAGLVSTAFAAYPYMMFDYGVLYPFGLALSLLAPLWALSAMAWKFSSSNEIPRGIMWILMCFVAVGVALAHPSVLLVALLLNFAFATQKLVHFGLELRKGKVRPRQFVLAMAGFVLALGLTGYIIFKIKPGNYWKPQVTWPQATGELVLGGPVGLGAALVLSLLILIGFISLWRKRSWWILLSWALFAFLFLIGAAETISSIRSALIGLWFGDVFRMSAILAIVALPIAVFGLSQLSEFTENWFKTRIPRVPRRLVVSVLLIFVLLGVQVSNLGEEVRRGQLNYAMTPASPLLTPDEAKLLDQVDAFVPSDVTVGGSPWTGTALVYAFANRQSLFQHALYTPTPDQTLVVQSLGQALTNPDVCAAVKRLKLGYILDFGTAEVHGERHVFPGFENLDRNPAVVKVDSVGPASLWKITACGSIA